MAYRDLILADPPKFFWRAVVNPASTAAFLIQDISGFASNVNAGGVATYSADTGLISASGDTDMAFNTTAGAALFWNIGTASQAGNGPWTIEGWMQFAANPASNQAFFAIGNTTSGTSVNLTLKTDGHVQVDTNTTVLITSTGVLATNTPHYVCATYDGTTLSLYIDGITANTTATPGVLALTSSKIGILCDAAGGRLFVGTIDEVAYFSTSLSTARVQAHYLAGRKPYGTGDFYKQATLNALLRGTTLTAISTAYVALYITEPNDADSSGTELSGSGYARVPITNNTSDWAALTNSGTNSPYQTSNINQVSLGTASADWLYAGWFSLEDAASSSPRILWGQLTSPVKGINGQAGIFQVGSIITNKS